MPNPTLGWVMLDNPKSKKTNILEKKGPHGSSIQSIGGKSYVTQQQCCKKGFWFGRKFWDLEKVVLVQKGAVMIWLNIYKHINYIIFVIRSKVSNFPTKIE